MTVKLVGFDLDDCLFDSTNLSKQSRIKGIDAMIDLGLNVDRNEAIKMIQEIVNEYGSNSSKHYDIFIRRLNQLDDNFNLSFSDQFKYIARAVMAYHEEKVNSIKLYSDVQETLETLRNKGIKTAIITDGIPLKQYEKILRLNLQKIIDLVVISDEIGVKKPNPRLFDYCLKKFKIKGPETLYIGDRIDKDIIPALLNNIHSVIIHRGGKYDFHTTGIKIPEEIKPEYEINRLDEIFEIIDEINSKEVS